MPDLPAILEPQNRTELLRLVKKAGENHLSPAQTARLLNLSEKSTQILFYDDPEIAAAYTSAHLEEQLRYLSTVKNVASDPDNKSRFAAAKYLYELFSGNKSSNSTFNISIVNNPETEKTANSIKLIESIDAETVEKIKND